MIPLTKICSKCKEEKSSEAFYIVRPHGRMKTPSLQGECKECGNDGRKKRKSASTIAQRANNLKKTYGITIDTYNALLEAQNFKCKICGMSSNRNLSVDHEHSTGRIRGLLCGVCNSGLGMFKDSPHLLQKAKEYLES